MNPDRYAPPSPKKIRFLKLKYKNTIKEIIVDKMRISNPNLL